MLTCDSAAGRVDPPPVRSLRIAHGMAGSWLSLPGLTTAWASRRVESSSNVLAHERACARHSRTESRWTLQPGLAGAFTGIKSKAAIPCAKPWTPSRGAGRPWRQGRSRGSAGCRSRGCTPASSAQDCLMTAASHRCCAQHSWLPRTHAQVNLCGGWASCMHSYTAGCASKSGHNRPGHIVILGLALSDWFQS